MSDAVRANLDKALHEPKPTASRKKAKRAARGGIGEKSPLSIVKSVETTDEGNKITIVLALSPTETPTAQQKGAFVGKDGRIHFFTKAKVAKAEKIMQSALKPYAGVSRGWGRVPIKATFTFLFPYASGTAKKDRHEIGPMLERPDVDNLVKLHLDALTAVGYWEDDALVNTLVSMKRRTTGDPCITISLENLRPAFQRLFDAEEEYKSPTLFSQGEPEKPAETNPLLTL